MALVTKFVVAVKHKIRKEHRKMSKRVGRLREGPHEARKFALSVSDISNAENLVMNLRKYTSTAHFPSLNFEGLLSIGGRLGNSSLDSREKHPIVIPEK